MNRVDIILATIHQYYDVPVGKDLAELIDHNITSHVDEEVITSFSEGYDLGYESGLQDEA